MPPSLPPPQLIAANAAAAISEDLGSGDLTAALVPGTEQLTATIVVREPAVLCGVRWAQCALDQVAAHYDSEVEAHWHFDDTESLASGAVIASLQGHARTILTAERTMLNFLQLMSGTATVANRLQRLLSDTSCQLLDTRKTLPGLRAAQKYAVACGGARNHRHGLFDAYLVKENHIAACGSIRAAVETARTTKPTRTVEVEVESEAELREAIEAGADIAMLDNFSLTDTAAAVQLADGRIRLEASGGLEDESAIRAIAATGVDYISCGALTKHVRATDFSMRFTAPNVP